MLPDHRAAARDLARLERRIESIRGELYSRLTPWQRVLVARHPARPTTLDYIERLFTEFVEIHGDRRFADDHAIVAGMADYKGEPVLVVGHQKGRDTKQKIYRNFGYARPEGYRKALRAMQLAEKFGRPIVCFVDTPAAYPGIESEERGVAEAIALNLREMAMLDVPDRRGGARRRRQRRRARHRRGRPRADARVRHLQRHPARGVCRHPVARRRPQGRGRRGAQDHRARPAAAGIIDEIVPSRSAARTPTRGRPPPCSTRPCERSPTLRGGAADGARAFPALEARYQKFRAMGRSASRAGPRRDPGRIWAHAPVIWQPPPATTCSRGARSAWASPVTARAAGHRGLPIRTSARASCAHRSSTCSIRCAGRHGARRRAARARRSPARAHRRARRLRRGRHHVHRHPAPRARTARRRRRPLHPERIAMATACSRRRFERLQAEGMQVWSRSTAASAAPKPRAAPRELGIDLIITDHHEPDTELPDAPGGRQSQAARLHLSRQEPRRRRRGAEARAGALRARRQVAWLPGLRQDRRHRHAGRRRAAGGREPRDRQAGPRDALEGVPTRWGCARCSRPAGGARPSTAITSVHAGAAHQRRRPHEHARHRDAAAAGVRRRHGARRAPSPSSSRAENTRRRRKSRTSSRRRARSSRPTRRSARAACWWWPARAGTAASSASWPRRLVDTFYRPAIVLSIEDGVAHGSCRSIPGFDMLAALESCAPLLLRFGGHKQAAGLQIESRPHSRVPSGRQRPRRRPPRPDDLRPRLWLDGPLGLRRHHRSRVMAELATLAPFGPGQPAARCSPGRSRWSTARAG
jgi:hypothetical protein